MAESTETGTGTKTEKDAAGQLDLFAQQQAARDAKSDARQEELIQELRASRNSKPAPAQAPTPDRVFSATELQKMVDDGQINQAQATEYQTEIRVKQAVEESEKRMENRQKSEQGSRVVADKLDEFRAAIPELADKSSEQFKEAASAMQALLKEGKPDNAATELDALRMVFGFDPAKGRRPAASEIRETTSDRQRTVDSAGSTSGRRSERSASSGTNGLPSWLPPENAAFYTDMIKRGLYKGPKDPDVLKEFEIIKAKKGIAA